MKIKEYKSVLTDNGVVLKECGFHVADNRQRFDNPSALANFFSESVGIGCCADEFVYIACLDNKMRLMGCFQASHGSVNASMFPIREILQKSLLIGAVYIALSHNHPSGDVTPSQADIEATKRLKDAASIIGVPLVDHVIVSGNNYFSFMEENIL